MELHQLQTRSLSVAGDAVFSDGGLHTVLFKSLEASGRLGVPDRAVMHTTFHAIFIAVLVLRLGRKTVLARWVGCAYLFGAWFVLASGVYLGSLDAAVANEVSLAAADAYTTPWHWIAYALAGQSDWAYPVLAYNFYRGLYSEWSSFKLKTQRSNV